jgi:hypothetical protein
MNNEERTEIACDAAAWFIHQYLVKYGRIPVLQSKEKYGTVRVYCHLGYYGFYDLLYPGRVWVHWPRWLNWLDIKCGSAVMRVLNKIIVPYHKFVYRRAYKKAVEKYPSIRENILCTADFPDLLVGL